MRHSQQSAHTALLLRRSRTPYTIDFSGTLSGGVRHKRAQRQEEHKEEAAHESKQSEHAAKRQREGE